MEDFSKINHRITFNLGPKIEIFDTHSPVYLIEYYEWFGDDWALIYTNHNIKAFHLFKHNKAFRTKWQIKNWGVENELPVLLTQHTYNEENKNVLLKFEYPSYKIHKAWFEKAIKYMEKTGVNLFIESKYAEKLKNEFDTNITLINKTDNFDGFINLNQIYATYEIFRHEIQSKSFNWWESDGIFENHANHYKSFQHRNDWIKFSNEELIDDILGL
jgi:hypothetical protein